MTNQTMIVRFQPFSGRISDKFHPARTEKSPLLNQRQSTFCAPSNSCPFHIPVPLLGYQGATGQDFS